MFQSIPQVLSHVVLVADEGFLRSLSTVFSGTDVLLFVHISMVFRNVNLQLRLCLPYDCHSAFHRLTWNNSTFISMCGLRTAQRQDRIGCLCVTFLFAIIYLPNSFDPFEWGLLVYAIIRTVDSAQSHSCSVHL